MTGMGRFVGIPTLWLAALLLGAVLALPGAAAAQDQIPGDIRVRAPGVVHVGSYWVHLLGVRAPGAHGATQFRQEGHAEEICTADGVPYQCGLISQGTLARLSAGTYYLCDLQHFPGDPRHWGICRPYNPNLRQLMDGVSLNRAWVQSGWALADTTHTDAFVTDEAEARAAGRGMWAAAVNAPFGVPPDMPAQVSGPATVLDGNTLRVAGAELRLFGIDAPELFQTCSFRGPARSWGYSCGLQSRTALISLTLGKNVFCARVEVTGDTRAFARCWEANATEDGPAEGEPSINETMVRSGWALANRAVTEEFLPLEFEANRDDLGMYQGQRVSPANWRRGQR